MTPRKSVLSASERRVRLDERLRIAGEIYARFGRTLLGASIAQEIGDAAKEQAAAHPSAVTICDLAAQDIRKMDLTPFSAQAEERENKQ